MGSIRESSPRMWTGSRQSIRPLLLLQLGWLAGGLVGWWAGWLMVCCIHIHAHALCAHQPAPISLPPITCSAHGGTCTGGGGEVVVVDALLEARAGSQIPVKCLPAVVDL